MITISKDQAKRAVGRRLLMGNQLGETAENVQFKTTKAVNELADELTFMRQQMTVAPGKLGQIVTAYGSTYASTTSVIPFDNTIPQNTEGAAYPDAFGSPGITITPINANSTLVIFFQTSVVWTVSAGAYISTCFKDSAADAISTGGKTLLHSRSAGDTNAQVYKFRFGIDAGTAYVNGSSGTGAKFGGTGGTLVIILEILP